MTCPSHFAVHCWDGWETTTSHFSFGAVPPLEDPAALLLLDGATGQHLTRVAA